MENNQNPLTPTTPVQTTQPLQNPQTNPPVLQSEPLQNVHATPNVPPANDGQIKKVSWGKLVAYFLIGLFTNIFGLITAGLWIAIKVKENKKPRTISLLAGLGTALLVGAIFTNIVSPILQSSLIKKNPALSLISEQIKSDYPVADVGFTTTTVKMLSGPNAGSTTSTLKVEIFNKELTAQDRINIGKKVCSTLLQYGSDFTDVAISSVKRTNLFILTSDQSFTENRTCQEWNQ